MWDIFITLKKEIKSKIYIKNKKENLDSLNYTEVVKLMYKKDTINKIKKPKSGRKIVNTEN